MSKKPTSKAQPAKQGVELEAPFNFSHPSSRCPKHVSPISKRKLLHKFKTTERKLIRAGVYSIVSTCIHCGGFVKGTEDYTVTAELFNSGDLIQSMLRGPSAGLRSPF